jgi:predicted anti-sigma-YlaC factor YlaD
MVDDYLDFSRTESPPGKIVRHLEHCASCREYLEKSKSVHIALFRGLNDAYETDRLPDGFADRLASAVAEKRGGVLHCLNEGCGYETAAKTRKKSAKGESK